MLSVQCPQCETHLSLDPQVIRRSLGWARCGHCQHVFDAAQVALPTLTPHAPSPLANNVSANWPSLELPSRTPDASGDTSLENEQGGPIEAVNEPIHSVEASIQAGGSPDEWTPKDKPPSEESDPPAVQDHSIDLPPVDEPDSGLSQTQARDPILSEKVDGSAHVGAWGLDSLPVETKARNQLVSMWKWIGLALLVAVLAVQMVIGQREYIAARWPKASAPLKRMSDALGLPLESIKDVRQLHIAHSSITRTDDLQFQLELELKNEGLLAVALPQLELSLLDAEGHIWARRVLVLHTPNHSEWLLNPQSRQTAQTSWRMNEMDAAKVDGYRLRLVYSTGD